MNTANLVEWQRIDSESGLIEPWLTHPFMDEVKTWDLSKVVMLETGGGRSTCWWRSKCKWVDTIEANEDWGRQVAADCHAANLHNGRLFCETIADGTPKGVAAYFKLFPTDMQYNCIVVDGIYRYEVLVWALNHLKGRGGVIIADNWQQDYVWISPAAEQLMAPYKIHIFEQSDHTDNDGVNKWKTVYWIIDKD